MTTGLVLALMLAAQDPMMETNRAYSDCLLKLTVASLEEKKSVAEFEKAAETTCAAQRQGYHEAIAKSEIDFGSTEAEARTYADEELDNMLSAMKSNYTSYADSGSFPVID